MIVAELALLTERHGEASKEVKMPHQYSGKFFAKTENKSQNHQNSNLHQLYFDQPKPDCSSRDLIISQVIYDATLRKDIATCFRIRGRFQNQALTIYIQEAKEQDEISDRFHSRTQKFWFIYDATVMRSITTCFRNGIASTYVQEAKERDAISDTLTVDWCDRSDIPFLECPTGLYGTLRERFSRDQMTQQVIYDATLWKDMAAGSKISDMPNSTLRERSIHDAITQQPQSIYDATEWRSINPGDKNQTQKSRSIYDAMVWANLSIGDGIAPHPILSMTERHRYRHFICDGMS